MSPPARSRGRVEGGCPVRIMRKFASLSGATTCRVDRYAFRGTAGAGIPPPGRVYAGCWIRTSENYLQAKFVGHGPARSYMAAPVVTGEGSGIFPCPSRLVPERLQRPPRVGPLRPDRPAHQAPGALVAAPRGRHFDGTCMRACPRGRRPSIVSQHALLGFGPRLGSLPLGIDAPKARAVTVLGRTGRAGPRSGGSRWQRGVVPPRDIMRSCQPGRRTGAEGRARV